MKAQYFSLTCIGFVSVFSLCGFPISKAYAADSTIQVEPPTPRDRVMTQIKFCNKTSNETVYGAFSSFPGSSGWRSDGWYEVKPRQCKTVNVGRGYQGDIYVFAQSDNLSWGGKDSSFCVNKTESFSIPNSDKSCSGVNYKLVGMKKITFGKRSMETFNVSD